ncbi:MAG: hypothetical protein WD016_09170 [Balneolaceae bacterium]
MNTKNIVVTALLMFLIGFTAEVTAQFQGKIEMKAYTEDKGVVEENVLNMFVTADRIMIKGEDNVSIADNVDAEGLLIRNDKKDFILLTGNNQAIQVTKTEIEGMIQMFSSWGGDASQTEPENTAPSYRFTDRTRTILGKECAELVIDDEDNPGNSLSVWLTPKVDINWGMLAEPWKNIPKSMEKEINGMSQDLFFQGKNFPMLIEKNEGEKVETVFEVTSMQESNVAKAMVELPSGISLIGAKEFMFNMMMQR